MPDFTARHPLYARFAEKWRLMRESVRGSDAIKAAGERYLPMPDGMRDPDDPKAQEAAYRAYKARAQYPDIVAPTIRAMVGVIHREPASIALPEAMEPMRERITRDGLTLESLHRRITQELMTVGRCGLLPEAEPTGSEHPYIALYEAEAIVNWNEAATGVDLVVLDESADEMNPETFAWTRVERFRVLRLQDGQYIGQAYKANQLDGETYTPTMRGGKALTEIPFVFVDTTDLTPAPDEVPLYGLAEVALSIYRMDADYRQTLFMVGQPQRWCSGVQPEDVPDVWGSSVVWVLPPPEAQAGILEFTGQGAGAQRQAILDDFDRAAQLGARLFNQKGGQPESGDARRIRNLEETAALATIAKTSAAALERALRWCAVMMGADPAEVSVNVDTKFMDATLAAQEMRAILENAMSGLTSKQTAYELLQAGGRANPERSWEDERELIEQDGPSLSAFGNAG